MSPRAGPSGQPPCQEAPPECAAAPKRKSKVLQRLESMRAASESLKEQRVLQAEQRADMEYQMQKQQMEEARLKRKADLEKRNRRMAANQKTLGEMVKGVKKCPRR